MGFRLRKSFRVAKGVRLTVSKSGISTSFGVKGARYTIHSSGKKTASFSIPGTGIGYVSSSGGGSGRKSSSGRSSSFSRSPISATHEKDSVSFVKPIQPGILAPPGERLLYKAISSEGDMDLFKQVADNYPAYRNLALTLYGLQLATQAAIPFLQEVFDKKFEPQNDPFYRKYLSQATGSVKIAPGIHAKLPISRDLIGLILGELYQARGLHERAIHVVERLEPSTYAAVSLAELYIQTGKDQEVIKLTNGLTNVDESSTILLLYRAVALRNSGHFNASLEALRESLRYRSRPDEIRHLALFERAKTYIQLGKNNLAKKDLEKIMSKDSTYPGLVELLQSISNSSSSSVSINFEI